MSCDPQLREMPFSITGPCAALRGLYLKSAPFAGSAPRCCLPTPVLHAAAAGIGRAALKIGRKLLPVTTAISLKSP